MRWEARCLGASGGVIEEQAFKCAGSANRVEVDARLPPQRMTVPIAGCIRCWNSEAVVVMSYTRGAVSETASFGTVVFSWKKGLIMWGP